MKYILLADDLKTPLEEVHVIDGFNELTTISRYDFISEMWFQETVPSARVIAVE